MFQTVERSWNGVRNFRILKSFLLTSQNRRVDTCGFKRWLNKFVAYCQIVNSTDYIRETLGANLRMSLESCHTAKTVDAENNSCPLPNQCRIFFKQTLAFTLLAVLRYILSHLLFLYLHSRFFLFVEDNRTVVLKK